jgi:hypothetical protein
LVRPSGLASLLGEASLLEEASLLVEVWAPLEASLLGEVWAPLEVLLLEEEWVPLVASVHGAHFASSANVLVVSHPPPLPHHRSSWP